MCNSACIDFVKANLKEGDIKGKRIIEVGSFNVNGTLRPFIEAFGPAQYTGVDLFAGPGVDIVCDAADLIDIYGEGKFDLLISPEMLEHVLDWRKIVSNFKRILRPDGVLLITTRSKGFFYHGYPHDFWRFEVDDMKRIFSDLEIISLERDLSSPGVFIRAQKPRYFVEKDLANIKLYSLVSFRRSNKVSWLSVHISRYLYSIKFFLSNKCPASWKSLIRKDKYYFCKKLSINR